MADKRLPYGRQSIDGDDVEAIALALRADLITQGPEVARFEEELAKYCGAPYAVAVSSGTAALHLATLAAGVSPGDHTITSPMTFVATSNATLYAGGTPHFADIDRTTRNLSPRELERAIASGVKPKAVTAVHYAGLPADMLSLNRIARGANATIIEDACHAIGAEYRDTDGTWRRVGACTHSDLTCFSFHPVKHITTGEGGAITTRDPKLYQRLLDLRSHGITRDPARMREQHGPWYYEMHELGFNYRMTDLQCALGRSQLRKLAFFVARRREIASAYAAGLAGIDGVVLPAEPDGFRSSYHLYPLWFDEARIGKTRSEIFAALTAQNLGVQVHYLPVHLQPYYRDRFGTKTGQFPEAEHFYQGEISIPMYPKLEDGDVQRVIATVRAAVA